MTRILKHALMNIMNKLTRIISAASLLSLTSAVPAFAQGSEITIAISAPRTAINPGNTSIGAVIGFLVGAAVVFAVIAALLFILIGAFQWITSGGDKGKVESARNHIVAAIIGLIIIVLTLVIVNFVLELLGVGSLTNLRLQRLQTP